MGYATQQDMVDRFEESELISLTDSANTGTINAVVLGKALADADAEIEGYLVGRYQLPLASVPPVLTRIACDVARYYLYDDHAPEHVRTRYEDARKLLEGIASGRVQLGLPASAGAAPVAGAPEVSASAPERVFTTDTLRDF